MPSQPTTALSRRSRALAALLALATTTACEPSRLVAPSPADSTSSVIVDGAHPAAFASAHFYFLSPTVYNASDTPFPGAFDATLQPVARVCAGTGSCRASNALASFDANGGTGGGADAALLVRDGDEAYTATWSTRTCATGRCSWTPGGSYRLHVYATNARGIEVELGSADIAVTAYGTGTTTGPATDLGNYSPLVVGLPYSIAFRVEQGVVGDVQVGAATSPFKVGDSQQLVASVRDLHGAAIATPSIGWRSTVPGVASVDGAGVITALDSGSTIVSATADNQRGSTTVRVLPASVNAWTSRGSMLAARYGFAAASLDGIVYAMGGSNNASTLASVEAYDPATNVWTARAAMSAPRYAPSAGAVGGRIYVAGGLSRGVVQSSVEAYDPATNSWSAVAPMQTPRYGATAGVIGGILYVAGGYGGGAYQSSVEAYDPATNTWTTVAPMSTGRYGAASGVIGGRLFVAGGSSASASTGTSLEAYDPATNTWTAKAPLLAPRSNAGAGVIAGGLYLVGGFSNGDFLATADAYDAATDTWTTRAPMSTLRYFPAAAVTGGALMLIGGEDRYNVLSSSEAYTP